MSTPDYPNKPPVADFTRPSQSAPLAPPKENGWGIAGFITSVIGIITCGTLSIVGVVLSAIGLRKQPKGMAIAGLIIGLIGLVELIVGIVILVTLVGAGQKMAGAFQEMGTTGQLTQKANEIGYQWEANEKLPTQAEGDALVAGESDMWGNPFQYETDDTSFSLRSSGADGMMDSEDDIVVGPYADATSAQTDVYSDFEADWEEEWDAELNAIPTEEIFETEDSDGN
jgi:hypothetical protein